MKKMFGISLIVALVVVISAVAFAQGMMKKSPGENKMQSSMMDSGMMQMMGGMSNHMQNGTTDSMTFDEMQALMASLGMMDMMQMMGGMNDGNMQNNTTNPLTAGETQSSTMDSEMMGGIGDNNNMQSDAADPPTDDQMQSSMMDSGMMDMMEMMQIMGEMSADHCMQNGIINPIVFADELGLSEEQQNKINDIIASYKEGTAEKNAGRDVLETELTALIDQDQPDQDTIKEQVQKIANLEADIRYSQIKANLDIKSVLTQEQRDALKELLNSGNAPMMEQPTKPENPENSNNIAPEDHAAHHK